MVQDAGDLPWIYNYGMGKLKDLRCFTLVEDVSSQLTFVVSSLTPIPLICPCRTCIHHGQSMGPEADPAITVSFSQQVCTSSSTTVTRD